MLPSFLVKPTSKSRNIRRLRERLSDPALHTVCEEARCPNIGECYSNATCTFLILGDTCTRNCAFCGIVSGRPLPPDPSEPERIAEAVKKLNLNYVVITSVARDDLPDGGARQFAEVVRNLRLNVAVSRIEVLIPDFQGKKTSLQTVLEAGPDVLNHNIETMPRLYSKIRPQADYRRSLELLRRAKEFRPAVYTKSGFMVGLGETREEIEAVLRDLRSVNCDIVTIGQYLPPSREHPKPERYVAPEEFTAFKAYGSGLGFLKVSSGPFVRSSYQAEQAIK